MVMSEETFERQVCKVCGYMNFCILDGTEWLCDVHFSWKINDAARKDKILAMMINCGIEDIEQ